MYGGSTVIMFILFKSFLKYFDSNLNDSYFDLFFFLNTLWLLYHLNIFRKILFCPRFFFHQNSDRSNYKQGELLDGYDVPFNILELNDLGNPFVYQLPTSD